MAIVSGYLVLSLPFSIVAIIRPRATAPRLLLIILDTVIPCACWINYYRFLLPFQIADVKNCVFSVFTGRPDSKHGCRRGCYRHSLLSSQWQLRCKLACYLQPIWWFLPKIQRRCGGVLHCSCCALGFNCDFCFSSPKALTDQELILFSWSCFWLVVMIMMMIDRWTFSFLSFLFFFGYLMKLYALFIVLGQFEMKKDHFV